MPVLRFYHEHTFLGHSRFRKVCLDYSRKSLGKRPEERHSSRIKIYTSLDSLRSLASCRLIGLQSLCNERTPFLFFFYITAAFSLAMKWDQIEFLAISTSPRTERLFFYTRRISYLHFFVKSKTEKRMAFKKLVEPTYHY